MPCASTPNADYPDYIKSILKTIAVGNDTTLKNCACPLKSPVDDDGCVILDSDGKVGVFPFCMQEAVQGNYGPGTDYPFEMSLEDAMALYWKYKSFKVTGQIFGSFSGDPGLGIGPQTYNFTVAGTGTLIDTGQPKMSDVVCNNINSMTFSFQQINNELPTDPVIGYPSWQGLYGVAIAAGSSVKKTPNGGGLQLKIYPFFEFNVSLDVASTDGASSIAYIYTKSVDYNPDPDHLIKTTVSDGLKIKINGTTYTAPMYIFYPSILSGSASGSLIIEGVEKRLIA